MLVRRTSSITELEAQVKGPGQGDYCSSANDDEIQRVGFRVRAFPPPEAGPVRLSNVFGLSTKMLMKNDSSVENDLIDFLLSLRRNHLEN